MQQQTQTVYTSASDASRFNYLQTKNYLGEYKTDVEKARVRYNLGIPDSFAMTWGNISGSVANQADLVSYIRSVKNDILNQYRSSADNIVSLQESISALNANATTANTGILNNQEAIALINTTLAGYTSIMERLQEGLDDLSEMKTDIAQNATDIASLAMRLNEMGTGGSGSGSSSSSLISRIQSLESSLTSLQTRIASLEGQVGEVTLTEIKITPTSISGVTTESDDRTVKVTAVYSNGSTQNVTSGSTLSSSDTSVARVDNTNKKIQFVGIGTATITVTYEDFTKTISVSVTESTVEQTKPQYIGFGKSYSEAYTASRDAGFTSLNGTWTPANIPCGTGYSPGEQLDIYIITTQNIISVIEIGQVSLETIATNVSFNDISGYTVYKVLSDPYECPVESINSTLTITTQ